ncbi:MAG: hypothetical protein JWO81_770 [Alphaproteobacteria bacterium]|nr:hypothetical protein [Alphaproteobacteria bacterium]
MTLHLDQRMNQRGITRELLDLTLTHGEWEGDRCILSRKGIERLIRECEHQRRLAMKALDKGGLVVVETGGAEITTYRLPRACRKGR